MADDDRSPEDDFQELLRQLFGGQNGPINQEDLQKLTGMQMDPAMLQGLLSQLSGAFSGSETNSQMDWSLANRQALHIANQDGQQISSGQRTDHDQAFSLANLWLSEATTISELSSVPQTLTRGDWVNKTMPVWEELASPVAYSITDALMQTLNEQLPEEMRGVIDGAGRIMRSLSGSLFVTQLGQIIGRLSKEVVSGGDVGIPLLPAGEAAILPQNFADFSEGLEISNEPLALYLATRELAHARLFRHAKWLRLHVITQITEYARGVEVDMSALESIADNFSPGNTDDIRAALESGALLPTRSQAQNEALERLENLLATIEGWVDVVTEDATMRLPEAVRIAEAVRRRRAVGGPAEQALGALVGLELRPRRLREASLMWRQITDAVGIDGRDRLWDYPDVMPTAEDLNDPAALIARLTAAKNGEEAPRDAMDDALEELLRGTNPETGQPISEAPDEEPGQQDDSGEEPPHGPTPV